MVNIGMCEWYEGYCHNNQANYMGIHVHLHFVYVHVLLQITYYNTLSCPQHSYNICTMYLCKHTVVWWMATRRHHHINMYNLAGDIYKLNYEGKWPWGIYIVIERHMHRSKTIHLVQVRVILFLLHYLHTLMNYIICMIAGGLWSVSVGNVHLVWVPSSMQSLRYSIIFVWKK